MREKLTDMRVAKLKPPAKGRLDLWDAMLPGFGLRVTEKGKKSWVVMYRVGGRTAPKRRLTLGHYPSVSLLKARENAAAALAQVAKGEDPAMAKAEVRAAANTFELVAAEFIERYAKAKNRGWKRQKADIARELLPYWTGRPIADLKRSDILDILDRVSDRTSPLRANRVLALIRKLFNWCLERGLLDMSPAANVKPPGKEQSRDRVLSDEEIRDVSAGCERLGYPFGALFKLLLITGQRRDEVGTMRWSDLDQTKQNWTVPREISKNNVANEVPLSSLALAVIASLPQFAGDSYLFPAANGSGRPASGYSKAKLHLDKIIAEQRAKDGKPPMPTWWLHDLRRTAASSMARLGVAPHVIERVLNHVSGSQAGVAGIYNRYGYLNEKRNALELWAQHLEKVISLPHAYEGHLTRAFTHARSVERRIKTPPDGIS